MADNIAVTAGAGTTVSTEEVTTLNGGAVSAQHVQRVGVASVTANGTVVDVTSSNPLPITGASIETKLDTLAGYLDTVEANQATGNASLATLATADPAHDAADSGSPVKIGGRAVANLSGVTTVAAADRTDGLFSLDGSQFVRTTPLADLVSGLAAITDGSSTSVISAQGSGVKTYIKSVIIANSSATAVTVDLRDGTAGSVKATFPVPAGAGVVFNFGDAPLGFTANTAVAADPSASATTVTVTLVGFKSTL